MEKKRILVVDDEEIIRTLLLKAFKFFGYEIDTVENGIEAVKRIASKAYDLIITDYRMPEMNGLELTRRIKMINPSIPVLVITSDGPECELLKSGALACIKKPFNILELQKISQNILDGRPPST
ncbi:MAG: response regulator [Thermodesulfobacteriota bacterium]|nr:response regulator [Thermodesulfobacteriota bacterium]